MLERLPRTGRRTATRPTYRSAAPARAPRTLACALTAASRRPSRPSRSRTAGSSARRRSTGGGSCTAARIRPGVERGHPRLERHAADRTAPRCVAHDLRVHRARVLDRPGRSGCMLGTTGAGAAARRRAPGSRRTYPCSGRCRTGRRVPRAAPGEASPASPSSRTPDPSAAGAQRPPASRDGGDRGLPASGLGDGHRSSLPTTVGASVHYTCKNRGDSRCEVVTVPHESAGEASGCGDAARRA